MHKLALVLPLALSACAAPPSQRLAMNQVAGVCDARALASFAGQLPTPETGLKMMGFARAQTLRWVPHGGAMTMDHNPQRLTVQLDAQGRIATAQCG